MRLTVVGCAGSFPTPASPGSCYLVEHEGSRIVLDLGNGALGALQEYVDVTDPGSLAGLVLSHCHVDHCVDAASLYVARHYHPAHRFGPLALVGPVDARARLAQVYGNSDAAFLDRVFAFGSLADGPRRIGAFAVEAVRAEHPVEAYCIKVSADGRSITYSGDTGPSAGLVRLARGTDIALFEASFVGTGHAPGLHMSGADAGRAAADADAGLLLLTHLVAWNDPEQVRAEAAAVFDGPIELARPGLTVTL
ncbi:MAG: MBL fold metallo-hydrolase [Candidatus Nanopelagicales bacterium]